MRDPEEAENFVERLEREEIQDLADRLEAEISSRDKEVVHANLGMFDLKIESYGSLNEAQETFEEIWTSRIEEIEESRADTLREKLDEHEGGHLLFG